MSMRKPMFNLEVRSLMMDTAPTRNGRHCRTFAFHYRVLFWLGRFVPTMTVAVERRVLFIVLVPFIAHIVEIAFYGVAYAGSDLVLGLGWFMGAEVNDAMSYLYYSGVIYTSLGWGTSILWGTSDS